MLLGPTDAIYDSAKARGLRVRTSPGFPTPRATVADNDLALGPIVEAISKSRYWSESAIFVAEDDSQDGFR
jgi:hypothetical protein